MGNHEVNPNYIPPASKAKTLLNKSDRFCCVRVGKEGKWRILAFTDTVEDANCVVDTLLKSGERAVIEEFTNNDLIVYIERRGNKY